MPTITRLLLHGIALPIMVAAATAGAATGDPLPDVDVSLERRPGGVVKQDRTDPQGNFNFGVVTDGDYVITVVPGPSSGPRHVGDAVNVVAPGATAKSFFESRSNTVRSGSIPIRMELAVRSANPQRPSGAMQSDGVHRMQVSTSGGHIRGQITSQ